MTNRPTWDVIVVGGGPAGLAAATWLGRYRRRTLVVDGGDHRNDRVDRAHGYLGMDQMDPGRLREAARQDLGRYHTVEVLDGRRVTAVDGSIDDFRIELDDGAALTARRLVLATGFVDDTPDVEGFNDHFGAQLVSCPACDGFEARGASTVVLGWAEDSARLALTLLDWAAKVTVVTEGHEFEAGDDALDVLREHGVEVLEDRPVALLGPRFALAGMRLAGGRTIQCEQIFFTSRASARSELAAALGCRLTDAGCIDVDEHGATSVDGVYAAGDVVPAPHLVQMAAATGAVAGIGAALSFPDRPAAALD